MGPIDQTGLQLTRRHFFGQSATGIGMAALAGLLGNEARAEGAPATSAHGGLPGLPHFAPKSQARHLPVSVGRAVANGLVRLQAEAG